VPALLRSARGAGGRTSCRLRGQPQELEHLREGLHTYQVMRALGGVEVTLCTFCVRDFGSRDPAFFGLAPETRIGFEKMQFVRDVVPEIGEDQAPA
jgi:hypothetical protein